MKNLLLIIFLFFTTYIWAQEKKSTQRREPAKTELQNLNKCIQEVQGSVELFTQNYKDHTQEHDVNSIINDIEKYLDSMPRTRSYPDQLLIKNFNPLRHFFLITTNKTTVATSFLYPIVPYHFCLYNDTAITLYLSAIKDGSSYNLAKTTEGKIIKNCLTNCLLPALKAMDEFKEGEIKYIALSAYYGCKDTREGAPNIPVVPYCLTLVAKITDLQQYAAGLITVKGLLSNAELYAGDGNNPNDLRKILVDID